MDDLTADIAAAEQAFAGGDVPAYDAGAGNAPALSTEGNPPADPANQPRSEFIPRNRFDEVVEQRRQLEAELAQYRSQQAAPAADSPADPQADSPEPDSIPDWLSDPALADVLPQQPAAPADPEAQFSSWAEEQGIDLAAVTTNAEYVMLTQAFRASQAVQQLEAAREQAQQQALLADIRGQMQQVQAQFPHYSDPVLSRALIGLWTQAGEGVPLLQVAQAYEQRMGRILDSRMAEQAARQAQEAARPNTAGGAAPSAAASADWVHADDATFHKNFTAELAAALPARR